MVNTLLKFSAANAEAILTQFVASAAAQAFIQPTISSPDFLNLLIEKNLYADAIKFLAYGLPKREAVWWAYLCAKNSEKDNVNEVVKEALEKTKQWVYEPSDQNRRATQQLAEKLAYRSPASWAAIAAFWSEGSITAMESPAVTAPSHLTPAAVAGAVLLSGVLNQPEKSAENYQHYLAQGINIANSGNGEI